jgi:thiol-disulfide isomerase/thioredoxin
VPSARLVNSNSMIAVKIPLPSPPDFASYDAARRQAWFSAFRQSAEGKEFYRRQNRFGVAVAPDGTFRAEDVPPGHYQLTLSFRDAEDNGRPASVASASREIDVPGTGPGPGDEPFDIGAVELKLTNYRTVEVGQLAPSLVGVTLDGKPLVLADYRGKYVLLDFWATWCGPCLEEMPLLKDLHDAFGKDGRFTMIGLSLDESTEAPKAYVAKNGLAWTQAFLGRGGTSPATADFGVEGIPSIWLIGPDGRVVAKDLRGESIKAVVAAVLGRK